MESKGDNSKKNIISNVIYNEEMGEENIISELYIDGKVYIPMVEKYSKYDNIIKSIYNNNENYLQVLSGIKNRNDFARIVSYIYNEALSKNDDEVISNFAIIEDKDYKKTAKYKNKQFIVSPIVKQIIIPDDLSSSYGNTFGEPEFTMV